MCICILASLTMRKIISTNSHIVANRGVAHGPTHSICYSNRRFRMGKQYDLILCFATHTFNKKATKSNGIFTSTGCEIISYYVSTYNHTNKQRLVNGMIFSREKRSCNSIPPVGTVTVSDLTSICCCCTLVLPHRCCMQVPYFHRG